MRVEANKQKGTLRILFKTAPTWSSSNKNAATHQQLLFTLAINQQPNLTKQVIQMLNYVKLVGTKVDSGEISNLVLTANQKVGIYFPGYSRVWPWVVLL